MNIVILTGAGMSAESGISTFRDHDGLWENHRIEDVASPGGWQKDPGLVLHFYNARRGQLKTVSPNRGHEIIASWQERHQVWVVTQNVDDLHERAGSKQVLHLHGELKKVRSTKNPGLVYEWTEDLVLGDLCSENSQLRPHIVWFGEEVPAIQEAVALVEQAELLIIVGTSLQVYPAAGLYQFAPAGASLVYIDPKPGQFATKVQVDLYPMSATDGLEALSRDFKL
jgi:NAD-dependent deacetylase